MKTLTALPALAVLSAMTLAACGTASGVSAASPSSLRATKAITQASVSPAPVTTSRAPAPTPSPVDTASLTCKDFDAAAPVVVSALHALAQYLSTNSDPGPNLAELAGGMGVLGAMAPTCAPKAVEALAAMGSAAAEVAAVYDTGSDPSVIEADKKVLDSTKAAGVLAWKAAGWDVTPWDTALHYYF